MGEESAIYLLHLPKRLWVMTRHLRKFLATITKAYSAHVGRWRRHHKKFLGARVAYRNKPIIILNKTIILYAIQNTQL